ncbi:uncharacterized protein [Mobula birostris]|uniref:uncharacterized protein n=1 Tax=Mobula birostris TaxID=1983395 RepID=UPI003B281288
MDLECEADRSGLEQNSGREGQSPAEVHDHADTSTEKDSTKPSSSLDVTKLMKHSINKYKFQYPLQIGQPLGVGYEFVENEEFHYSSSLYIKELACVCRTIAKREVRNHKMVRAKLCFFCQREFFFTWALTCHFCKKINLFRVLYEDVNPFPCMHLPMIYKPLAARTVDAGVQAERYRCECEMVQQWDTNWKPKVEKQETTHVVEHR